MHRNLIIHFCMNGNLFLLSNNTNWSCHIPAKPCIQHSLYWEYFISLCRTMCTVIQIGHLYRCHYDQILIPDDLFTVIFVLQMYFLTHVFNIFCISNILCILCNYWQVFMYVWNLMFIHPSYIYTTLPL